MPSIDIKPSVKPPRTCGSCSLCCKLIHVEELQKPMGKWCPHCLKSGGCGIYDTRPNVCRNWNCEWLSNAEIGGEWQPLRSKMVMIYVGDESANKLIVHVDSGSPLAWRNEPYYSQLKQWARNLLEQNGMVNIYVRNQVIVVLPTKDVDLGTFKFGDKITLRKKWTGSDWEYDVFKVPVENAPPR